MYVIMISGVFQHAELGNITRKWSVTDEDGRTLAWFARRDALNHMRGIVNDTMRLSHGQLSQDEPRIVRIEARPNRDGFLRYPAWAHLSYDLSR